MIKEYETTVSKIIYYDKKKNEFLEGFREISLVGSLKQIVAKLNVCKTQVYEILKEKSELKERKIIWEKYTLIV